MEPQNVKLQMSKVVTLCWKWEPNEVDLEEPFQHHSQCHSQKKSATVSFPHHHKNMMCVKHYSSLTSTCELLSFIYLPGGNNGSASTLLKHYHQVKIMEFSEHLVSVNAIFKTVSQLESAEEVRIILSPKNLQLSETDERFPAEELGDDFLLKFRFCHIKTLRITVEGGSNSLKYAKEKTRFHLILNYARRCLYKSLTSVYITLDKSYWMFHVSFDIFLNQIPKLLRHFYIIPSKEDNVKLYINPITAPNLIKHNAAKDLLKRMRQHHFMFNPSKKVSQASLSTPASSSSSHTTMQTFYSPFAQSTSLAATAPSIGSTTSKNMNIRLPLLSERKKERLPPIPSTSAAALDEVSSDEEETFSSPDKRISKNNSTQKRENDKSDPTYTPAHFERDQPYERRHSKSDHDKSRTNGHPYSRHGPRDRRSDEDLGGQMRPLSGTSIPPFISWPDERSYNPLPPERMFNPEQLNGMQFNRQEIGNINSLNQEPSQQSSAMYSDMVEGVDYYRRPRSP